jgi:predicted RNA-binding Zn ribbon-like protein
VRLPLGAVKYEGPLRDEPAAIELHNTIYAVVGQTCDGLADVASSAAFLSLITPRLTSREPPAGPAPNPQQLMTLRATVRDALHSIVNATALAPETAAALNRYASAARSSGTVQIAADGSVTDGVDWHGASCTEVLLAAFAADTIELLTGPNREQVKACGAPGCVLLYLHDHPRRQWCSNACGNRARQARHYQRTHPGPPASEVSESSSAALAPEL